MRRIIRFSTPFFVAILFSLAGWSVLPAAPATAQTIRAARGEISTTLPKYTISQTTPFTAYVFLPLVLNGAATTPPPTSICPTTSSNSYSLIPVPGAPADRADYVHGDLNLSLRSWETATVLLSLVDFWGATDPNAPNMKGIFSDGRVPVFPHAYQVYDWNWGCPNDFNGDGNNDGCRGAILPGFSGDGNYWDTTLLGMQTTKGEQLHIPSRGPYIDSPQRHRALVLYAEETRLTIVYLWEDTIAHGYSVHFENVCTDPNLLALYRSRVDANGWRIPTGGYQLPGLDNGQPLGTALDTEIKVAIRDRGKFMDPRSRKDWWQ